MTPAVMRTRVYRVLVWAFVALMLADLFVTLLLTWFHAGSRVAREDNPLFAYWLAHQATWAVIAAKLLMTLFITRTLLWLARWYPTQIAALFACYDVAMAVVVAIDLHVLSLVH